MTRMQAQAMRWTTLVSLVALTGGCDKEKNDKPAAAQGSKQETEPASARIDDKQLNEAVTRALRRDPGVTLEGLEVKSTDGIIDLTGKAQNLLTRERAVRVVETVRGVRAVSDRIEVAVKHRPDEQIQADVESALLHNAAADSFEVKTVVDGGAVTLSGKVQSQQEREMARRVAEGVVGVKKVTNHVSVDYGAKRSDHEVSADVESRLRWDVLVNDGMINVDVRDGKVKLSGTVSSAAERRRALSDAWVRGARDVNAEGLTVAWTANQPQLRYHEPAKPPDADIHKAIRDAVIYDPRVASANLDIKVNGGVATLSGKVDTAAASLAAEDLARHTVGVTRVANELAIQPAKPVPDATLQQNAKNALLWDPYTDSYEITVLAKDGKVTLTGKVDTTFERAQATSVIGELQGVKDVDNRLEVTRGELAYVYIPYLHPYSPHVMHWHYAPLRTSRSDSAIAEEIRDHLTWSPFVDANEVSVQVKDGKATLTGQVDSYGEVTAATENAFEGGAIEVENRLRVQP